MPLPVRSKVSFPTNALLTITRIPVVEVTEIGLYRMVSIKILPGGMIKAFGRAENNVSVDNKLPRLIAVTVIVSFPVLEMEITESLYCPTATLPMSIPCFVLLRLSAETFRYLVFAHPNIGKVSGDVGALLVMIRDAFVESGWSGLKIIVCTM